MAVVRSIGPLVEKQTVNAWRYINYAPATGVSINTFRKPEGYANNDVRGLVEDIRAERQGTCDLDGAEAALEDGSLWSDGDQEALELLHNAIRDFKNREEA